MNTKKPVRPSGAWRKTLAAVAALIAAVGFGTPMSAYAGAGWGDTTNPSPSPSRSALSGTKVRTFFANTPQGMQVDVLTGTVTRDTGTALQKFLDPTPGLVMPGGGKNITLAVPDTTSFPGSDYYEIAVVEFREQLHANLPAVVTSASTHVSTGGSLLRGYVQIDPVATDAHAGLNNGATAPAGSQAVALFNPDDGTPVYIQRPHNNDGTFVSVQAYAFDYPQYLGATIVATRNRPTRVKFYNGLEAGPSGEFYYAPDLTKANPDGTTGHGIKVATPGVWHRNGDVNFPVDLTNPGTGDGPVLATDVNGNVIYKDLLCGDVLPGPNNTDATDPAFAANLAASACLGGYDPALNPAGATIVDGTGVTILVTPAANPDGTTTPRGYAHVPTYLQFTQNREVLHLHGGDNPWISDGHPHQWITPAWDELGDTGLPGETPSGASMRRGETAYTVPDMPNPGPGAQTYYWPNGQTGRLMFYHDHASGETRINVYAGAAAGYLLVDPVENALFQNVLFPGTGASATSPVNLAAEGIPLVIQEKTFVPKDIATEDSYWNAVLDPATGLPVPPKTSTGAAFQPWGGYGDLWFSHVYETNQDPQSADATNPVGRWDGASWFWPVFPQAYATPDGTYGKVSLTPETFGDTPMVNGIAYPTMHVEPRLYRFRILGVANDRMLNLSFFQADPTATGAGVGAEVKMVPFIGPNGPTAVTYTCPDGVSAGQTVGTQNANGTIIKAGWTESGPSSLVGNPVLYPNSFPCAGGLIGTGWGNQDGRPGGVPDPSLMGPDIIRVGNEGGLLEQPVDIPPTPVNYEYNKRSVTVLNVYERSLWLGPAERADILVDFSNYAGKTLILYNDSSAPVPAGDPRIDYYTGMGDQTGAGGAPDTLPGYGPNTRTVMKFVVDQPVSAGTNTAFTAGTNASAAANLGTAWNGTGAAGFYLASTQAYMAEQMVPDYPSADYTEVSGSGLGAGSTTGWNFSAIPAAAPPVHIYTGSIYLNKYVGLNFTTAAPICYTPAPTCSTTANCLTTLQNYRAANPGHTCVAAGTPVSAYVESKAIQELFEPDFGRMNATLGVELPFTNVSIQTTIPLGYVDPVTENIDYGETQFWKITHNGVDSHPVHFHMLNVQVIGRIGWDGTFKPVPADEIGWKETVKMHPLEDVIVAVTTKQPMTPFGMPHSQRHLAPYEANLDQHLFTQLDPVTGNAPTAASANAVNVNGTYVYANSVVDYGSEYVWHCHILGHEENDFMRPFIFHAHETLSPAASGVAAAQNAGLIGGVNVTWTDPTVPSAPGAGSDFNTVNAALLAATNNEIGFRVERSSDNGATWTAATSGLRTINTITMPVNTLANATSYLDVDVGVPNGALPQPVAPTLGSVTANSVTLNLPALVAPATSYTVFRNGAQVASGVTTATYTDSGLTVGTVYNYTIQAVAGATTSNYLYRVVAVTAAGDSPSAASNVVTASTAGSVSVQSAALPVTMAPAAPVVTVTNATVSSLQVNWGIANLATSYTVSMNGAAAVAATSPDVVAGLASNTTYTFVVNAINGTGTTASAPAVGLTVPGAPSGVAGGSPTDTSVAVSWVAPSGNGVLTYNVQCSTDPTFATTLACTGGANVIGTGAVVGGLAPVTTYYFRVQAVNASGVSVWSAGSAGVRTLVAAGLPGVPTWNAPAVTGLAANSLTLNWLQAATGGTPLTYTVQRATNATFTRGVSTWLNVIGTSLNVTGLNANTTYYFRVLAVNASGSSAYSATLTQATLALPAPPAAPAGLTLGALSTTAPQTITMTLPALPAGATSFTVYVQTRAGGGGAWSAGAVDASAVTATTYTSKPATPNLQYRFYLVAVGPAGSSANGANSAAVTPQELANPPATSQASANVGARTITVSWTAPVANQATVTGYRVLRSTSNATVGGVLSTGLTTTNVGAAALSTTTGRLTRGVTYYFQVASVTAGGVDYGPVLSAVAQ